MTNMTKNHFYRFLFHVNYEPQVISTYNVLSIPTRNSINNLINNYKMHLIVTILMVTIEGDQIDKLKRDYKGKNALVSTNLSLKF